MSMWQFLNQKEFNRDMHKTGEYIRYFKPNDKWNPFRKIYEQKKLDTIDLVKSSTNSNRILDVGGGMGRLSLDLAQSPHLSIFLTDISIEMLILARKNAGNTDHIKVINADAHQLPFFDNSFDCVVGLDLLCHLENPEIALREFHRVLNTQGVLVLDSTNSNPMWTLFYPRYLGKNPLNWIKIMRFKGVYPGWQSIVRHYSKKKFFSLLHNEGFEILQNVNYGPHLCPKWHLVVAKKAV